ncbi:flagellar biosynthetic protein FliO [Aestuariibacter sp. A3R04]|uniref:flagellar biosynthetic protein FliO n=1 Tax=Aestuariibacter sp. A3R04 TaxID=2841571 RepID=UPI001C099A77|nr:flagellar biosynthetic protein FliO [Aestuariibacter sp. A3R04]MBU3022216.1 flagellar biosynthetic protein FliO [Aestuariibacter sp. A3R04]
MLPLLFSHAAVADSGSSITNPTSVLSIFLSLLLVVGIIFSLAWLMRRFNVTHASSGQMKVVASMVAGTRERIMVIQVGDEQHIVGVTAHTINHLAKLETPLSPPEPLSSQGADFKEKLIKAMAGTLNPSVKEGRQDEK